MKIVGLSEKGARQLPLIISWAVFIILSSGYLFWANAGEILQHELEPNKFLLKGTIEAGDAGQVTIIPDNSILYLQSPGGDFLEGLAIGYVISQKNLQVIPIDDDSCYSACAFAASYAHDINGKLHFHAPYAVDTGMPTEPALEVMREYLRKTQRFTDAEIEQIANTSKDQYITFNFK